ncbi:hypothetical protein KR032_008485 [Drosophila birchii]|nr:hypothetical protein KR032_008485 [Drosophila birchii]
MWMHLANRAFLSGASAQKGLPITEDQGLVVLSSPTAYDIDDGDDSVHLTNPSMNELMQAIHTANQRSIIITQAGIQPGILQSGGSIFRAIHNDSLFVGDVAAEELQSPNSVAFLQDRLDYYPHFVREICSNAINPDYMHRALSFNDLTFVAGGGDDVDDADDADVDTIDDDLDFGSTSLEGDSSSSYTEPLLWRALSEGALITMPGDRNLAQQMAILKQPSSHPHKKRKADRDLVFTVVAPHTTWSPGYWITLAHIMAVIACHRWDL